MQGTRLVMFDNLPGGFGNSALDSAMTQRIWNDRRLGTQELYKGPLHICWWGTGNNVQPKGDMIRRICHIRLSTTEHKPETRTDFQIPEDELLSHTLVHRSELLSAAMTILRAWFKAGRPKPKIPSWGSFAEWSSVVRQSIVFAGLPDPGDTRDSLYMDNDQETNNVNALIAEIEAIDPRREGVTGGEIIKRINDSSDRCPDWIADLKEAIGELCKDVTSSNLGYVLRKYKESVFNGKSIVRAGERNKVVIWKVALVESPADKDTKSATKSADGRGDGGIKGDPSLSVYDLSNDSLSIDSKSSYFTEENHAPSSPHPPPMQ